MAFDLFEEMEIVVDGGACVLRPVPLTDFTELADLVGGGLFPDGDVTLAGWYDPDDLARTARRALAYHCSSLTDAGPERWTLPLGVWHDGRLVGVQGIEAEHYLARREAATGSFLAPQWRGRGLGTRSRHGIVAAAFTELDADWVVSAAMVGNAASKGVSQRVGYEADGMEVTDVAGQRQVLERFRLSRSRWEQNRASAPTVVCRGFEELRSCIGLT